MALGLLRQQIVENKHAEEHEFVSQLLDTAILDQAERTRVIELSRNLVLACRADTSGQTLLDSFLLEFGLSNKEGVALMCLAEALLRVPDSLTADRLIAEKIDSGDWKDHSGNSESLFVNFATWGMILTGKLVQLDEEITEHPGHWLQTLTSSMSEPLVRRAMLQAMKIMGGQYVLGRTIDEGIKRGRKMHTSGTRFSFDMLGEGARTSDDAERYYLSYRHAFERVGAKNQAPDCRAGDGVSVKLSALHPRYEFAQRERVMAELLTKITDLCLLAKKYNIGLSIDAEEAARLELSLDIFENLARNPDLAGWDGLGFVMQAYQKRAPSIAQWLVVLAKETGRQLMVRLVKGAYWDAEIKHAQEFGLSDYPVFTRKVNTDLCYLNCAKILLQAKGNIYPQFATHNAYSTVAIMQIADAEANTDYEFQRLYGMGELLYKHIVDQYPDRKIPLRVYAPIGEHRDLLPYLVRRLLENGANSSFVNRFLDNETPVDELVTDLFDDVAAHTLLRHTKIPTPDNLFIASGEHRQNAKGLDLDEPDGVEALLDEVSATLSKNLEAHSLVSGVVCRNELIASENPSDYANPAGTWSAANQSNIETALDHAHAAYPRWSDAPAERRAKVLLDMADVLEQNTTRLVGIISRDAGRTLDDGVSEVREAVDFCRYYAEQAVNLEQQSSQLKGRGVFVCISPWNFPLAIFTGQISAALAAGNSVIAKPAEQTPLVAMAAVELFHQAGCPADVLQLLLGDGAKIGGVVLSDPRVKGVAFTGSTITAQHINRQLGARSGESVAFIAETGGQNCMIVDSTALPEQVVDDVISSSFHSAGQRCSALRVLYLQDVIAEKTLNMLKGALAHVNVSEPKKLSTDIGPVIDQKARAGLQAHVDKIASQCLQQFSAALDPKLLEQGCFFAPRVFEVESIADLKEEVFGPVLHVIRYKAEDLDSVLQDINGTGFGLTLGVHSRIEAMADHIYRNTNVGNTYINRNVIGAVVGVNPFGGHGLSGTGPKAGGPSYLYRFLAPVVDAGLAQFSKQKVAGIVLDKVNEVKEMPGPTGESNHLRLVAKKGVTIVVSENDSIQLLEQLGTIVTSSSTPLTVAASNVSATDLARRISDKLSIELVGLGDALQSQTLEALLITATNSNKEAIRKVLTKRAGAIVPMVEVDDGLKSKHQVLSLLSYVTSEKTKTDNLVARGGNTQLFNLQEVTPSI